VAGDLCFISGQLPVDGQTGLLVEGGTREQTRRCLRNLLEVMEWAGFSPQELCQTFVVLADLDDWDEMNEAFEEVLGPIGLPARMAVGAVVPMDARVEIQGIAAHTA